MHNSFGTIKQINAGVLNVGYAEAGPSNGPPVILLHGWPCNIYSFAEVTPLLVEKGYRVIVPYLRGFGTTRFLADETVELLRARDVTIRVNPLICLLLPNALLLLQTYTATSSNLPRISDR